MKSAISLGLVVLVLLLSGRAHAAPTTIDVDALTTLVSAVAEAEQNVHRVQALAAQDRERVNAFIADAAQARVAADEAHRNELRASGALGDAEGRLDLLQKGFDRFAAASYVYGPPIASAETIADPAELMATAALTESIVSVGRMPPTICRRRELGGWTTCNALGRRRKNLSARWSRQKSAALMPSGR